MTPEEIREERYREMLEEIKADQNTNEEDI
jgi:hypothetical protein